MLKSERLTNEEVGEMVVDYLGITTVDHVSRSLGTSKGRVLGWCDRIREAMNTQSNWHSEAGEVLVQHTASWGGDLSEDTLVTFDVSVENHTTTTLNGVHLVQRSFINENLDRLEYETHWQFIEGSHADLAPGGCQRYRSRYRISGEDLDAGGSIINAIAIQGRTASGQQFNAYADALIWISE